ncbi:predicted protein [Streptomyces viridosporus ATCC 14672]|uniref:Predicted protein n=1 Tax=Streptomyces viridosporus (strain ATCC 14672 / DSM 40746 / JCM 4963 / KCTC 9882 / NRRL B-12104 / FH 1290) TaxID=566461 RepID=D6A909_STRV1|nr:predicted protein [Streptomyces viridosporus ATCC 14672]
MPWREEPNGDGNRWRTRSARTRIQAENTGLAEVRGFVAQMVRNGDAEVKQVFSAVAREAQVSKSPGAVPRDCATGG